MSVLHDARKLINGLTSPDTTLSLRRQSVCARCPFRRPGVVDRCAPKSEGGCGCAIVAKTRLATESCPNGYW